MKINDLFTLFVIMTYVGNLDTYLGVYLGLFS
jgi:hypothetical protein